MPHVSHFLLGGVPIPSVNEVTASLSKDGLIDHFYRPLGFAEADKQGEEARKAGIKLTTLMEKYRQSGKAPKKLEAVQAACVGQWTEWYEASAYQVLADEWVEPHLVNTVACYHGSPDVVLHGESEEHPILGDDKLKKRFADYRLLMNEHAYAMCDSYVDKDGLVCKLPWTPPIRELWFWTYSPRTGKLYPTAHKFNPAIYADFLTCMDMLEVNKRAEAYFKAYAVLLPEEQ